MKKLFGALLVLVLIAQHAVAQTIDQLGAGGAVQSTDMFPAYQGANPATRVTAAQIKTFTGGVTSVATACGLSGGPITATGTITGTVTLRTNAAATDTILAADCGNVVYENRATAVAITQPAPSGSFAAGFFTTICNINTGAATITPGSGNIGGGGTYAIPGGTAAAPVCASYQSDGSNFNLVPQFIVNASLLTAGSVAVAQLGASAASHAVPVDVAGTSTYKVLPDCTDTGGNHLNYTQSSDAFSCGTSGSGGTTLTPGPGYVASNWYFPAPSMQLTTGTAVSANVIRCSAGTVYQKSTLSALGGRLTTAGTNAQFAIYTSSGGRPGALVASTGNIDVTGSAGAKSGALLANKQVGPGGSDGDYNLFFCYNIDNAATVLMSLSQSGLGQGVLIGTATIGNLLGSNVSVIGISCSGAACQPGGSSTLGTWPASLVGSTWTDVTVAAQAAVGFQVTSIP